MHLKHLLAAIAVLGLVFAIGCTQQRADQPSVQEQVERSLEQAGLQDISVEEDREQRILRLSGQVASEDDKMRAEDSARQVAGNYTISNEISIEPAQAEEQMKDKTEAQQEQQQKEPQEQPQQEQQPQEQPQ